MSNLAQPATADDESDLANLRRANDGRCWACVQKGDSTIKQRWYYSSKARCKSHTRDQQKKRKDKGQKKKPEAGHSSSHQVNNEHMHDNEGPVAEQQEDEPQPTVPQQRREGGAQQVQPLQPQSTPGAGRPSGARGSGAAT